MITILIVVAWLGSIVFAYRVGFENGLFERQLRSLLEDQRLWRAKLLAGMWKAMESDEFRDLLRRIFRPKELPR